MVRLSPAAGLLAALLLPAAAFPEPRDREPVRRLREAADADVAVDPATGTPRWARLRRAPATGAAGREAETFGAFLGRHGDAFGVERPEAQLAAPRRLVERSGRKHLSYQQLHEGVPVFGAMLQAHFDARGQLYAVNGTLVPDIRLSTAPSIREEDARARAVHFGGRPGLAATRAELVVYRAGLARGVPGPNHLAWRVRVGNGRDVAEDVFVDAHTGKLVDRIAAIHTAIEREVYEAALEPGALVWKEGDPYPFTGANADAINDLVAGSQHTYDLFKRLSGGAVLSYDGKDAVMQAVNNDPDIACPNANWDGTSINFCNGTTADDVVAHEWTHAYTENSHALVYAYQSGALNEAYSDIFGEAVDWSNRNRVRAGTDAPDDARLGHCTTWSPPRVMVKALAPRAVAGGHPAAGAGFGPALTTTGVRGTVAAARPADACTPLTTGLTGLVALVDAGGCEPTTKVRNAQDAGAVAVIVVNDLDGVPEPLAGTDETIVIPSVIVSAQTGARLRETLGALSVRLQAANVERSVRWLMGEDATGFEGAIRDMYVPTCFGDPGKVSDAEYWCGPGDGGGVHFNSGVVNHAFALLVDGGSYNGRTIVGQGWTRALAVYHRAMRVYQTPFTNFRDHADALEQSCADLLGARIFEPRTGRASSLTITEDTCRALSRAIEATELRRPPTQCGFQSLLDPETPAWCEAGEASPFFFEPFDAEPQGWTTSTETVFDASMAGGWAAEQGTVLETHGKRSGRFLAARTVPGDCTWGAGDASQVMFADTPVLTVPPAAATSTDGLVRLAVEHWFATEPGYDGGNVSLRHNGGAWTLLPYEEFTHNGYIGFLYDFDGSLNTNPLQGQDSFTWFDPDSPGLGTFGVSLANLKDLQPGDTFQLRFAFGQDGCSPDPYAGWLLDSVRVYGCQEPDRRGARLSSPPPGSVLPRMLVTFSWAAVPVEVVDPPYRVQVGTSPDGPWTYDRTVTLRRTTFNLGAFAPGATVHVRLSTNVDGKFGAWNDAVFTLGK